MNQALLNLSNVHVRYGQALAVNGVSIAVQPGQVTAIVGPNGAGKSSLLKAISGLIPMHRCGGCAGAGGVALSEGSSGRGGGGTASGGGGDAD